MWARQHLAGPFSCAERGDGCVVPAPDELEAPALGQQHDGGRWVAVGTDPALDHANHDEAPLSFTTRLVIEIRVGSHSADLTGRDQLIESRGKRTWHRGTVFRSVGEYPGHRLHGDVPLGLALLPHLVGSTLSAQMMREQDHSDRRSAGKCSRDAMSPLTVKKPLPWR